MKYVPHDYQSYATQFILDHPVAAILLQMGLGKSVITLTAMQELFAGERSGRPWSLPRSGWLGIHGRMRSGNGIT